MDIRLEKEWLSNYQRFKTIDHWHRLNVPAHDVLEADVFGTGTFHWHKTSTSLIHCANLFLCPSTFLPKPPQRGKLFMIRDPDCRSGMHEGHAVGRVQLKCDGTRWHMGGEVKGKLANGVGSQYSTHYLGTWCIQHYYRLMRTPRLPVVDWTDAPADLNGHVRFAERRNIVSARVPSHFKCSLRLGQQFVPDICHLKLLMHDVAGYRGSTATLLWRQHSSGLMISYGR